jgi:hypothetical protein
MPNELRERADEVIAMRRFLEVRVTFDDTSGDAVLSMDTTPPAGGGAEDGHTATETDATDGAAHSTPRRESSRRRGLDAAAQQLVPPLRFQLQLTGSGCWPTLGQLTVRSVRFRARVALWWDVFESKVHLAFLRASEAAERAQFVWDTDLSLLGCGLPLPEAIEDRCISALVTFILDSHNPANPLVLDLQKARARPHAYTRTHVPLHGARFAPRRCLRPRRARAPRRRATPPFRATCGS